MLAVQALLASAAPLLVAGLCSRSGGTDSILRARHLQIDYTKGRSLTSAEAVSRGGANVLDLVENRLRSVSGQGLLVDLRDEVRQQAAQRPFVKPDQQPRPDEAPEQHHRP